MIATRCNMPPVLVQPLPPPTPLLLSLQPQLLLAGGRQPDVASWYPVD
jgi:hypothetical protein